MHEKLIANKFLICGISIFLLSIAFLYINLPFLVPLILAGIFALGLSPLIDKLSKRYKKSRNGMTWSVLLVGFCLFWIPLAIAVYRIIVNVSNPQTLQSETWLVPLNAVKAFVITKLNTISEFFGIDLATPLQNMTDNLLNSGGNLVLNYSSQFLSELPTVALASFVFTIALFSFLLRGDQIGRFVKRYSIFDEQLTLEILHVTQNSCKVTLFSTFAIGLIQAAIIGIGSLVFQQGDFWLVMTITFFVSFIPVIGAAPMGFLLALLAYLQDKPGAAAGLLVVAIIAGTIDNVLKPIMVGRGENNVSGVVSFTCVVGAIVMMGIPGLLLGPVIMNLFVGVTPVLLKYLRANTPISTDS
jgi:predicted PurR-regulated permease PerM